MARKGQVIWHAVRRVSGTESVTNDATTITAPLILEKHLAMRQDGKILKRLVVEYRDREDGRQVRRHDYGWKRAKLSVLCKTIEEAKAFLEPKGYVFKKL